MPALDALETAVLTTLQAALPAAITAENALHSDGVLVPQVVTWHRGLAPDTLEFALDALPLVAVGCYADVPLHADPEDPLAGQQWGELNRPVEIVALVHGATSEEAHLRLLRLVRAVQQVCAAQAASGFSSVCTYWPYHLRVLIEPPTLHGSGGGYVSIAGLEASEVRVVDAP